MAISSYAEKKNGSETGTGTNRTLVEVARRSQAPRICVEGAVCRLEELLFKSRRYIASPFGTGTGRNPRSAPSTWSLLLRVDLFLSSPVLGVVIVWNLVSPLCVPALYSYTNLYVCCKCLAHVCRVNKVGPYYY